jgi:hypothetical protein
VFVYVGLSVCLDRMMCFEKANKSNVVLLLVRI